MSVDVLKEEYSEILNFHCPRFNELPHVSLYKDQVISYIEDILKAITVNKEEKLLTPTMVNNYVKQKLVSPPKAKRYNERHLAYLIVVCVFKQVFSIQEICKLKEIQIETNSVEEAYDYFCTELENILKAVFITRDFSKPSSASQITYESELLRSTIMCFAHKLFIQKQIN